MNKLEPSRVFNVNFGEGAVAPDNVSTIMKFRVDVRRERADSAGSVCLHDNRVAYAAPNRR